MKDENNNKLWSALYIAFLIITAPIWIILECVKKTK